MMPTVYGELEIAWPTAQVYEYLRDRYKTHVFHSVCMMTKGYVPEVHCVEEQENERLVFSVAGRLLVEAHHLALSGAWRGGARGLLE